MLRRKRNGVWTTNTAFTTRPPSPTSSLQQTPPSRLLSIPQILVTSRNAVTPSPPLPMISSVKGTRCLSASSVTEESILHSLPGVPVPTRENPSPSPTSSRLPSSPPPTVSSARPDEGLPQAARLAGQKQLASPMNITIHPLSLRPPTFSKKMLTSGFSTSSIKFPLLQLASNHLILPLRPHLTLSLPPWLSNKSLPRNKSLKHKWTSMSTSP